MPPTLRCRWRRPFHVRRPASGRRCRALSRTRRACHRATGVMFVSVAESSTRLTAGAAVDRHPPEIAVLRDHERAAVRAPERTVQLSAGGTSAPRRSRGQSAAYGDISDVDASRRRRAPTRTRRDGHPATTSARMDAGCRSADRWSGRLRRGQSAPRTRTRARTNASKCLHSDAVYRDGRVLWSHIDRTLCYPTFRTSGQMRRRNNKNARSRWSVPFGRVCRG